MLLKYLLQWLSNQPAKILATSEQVHCMATQLSQGWRADLSEPAFLLIECIYLSIHVLRQTMQTSFLL